MGMLDYIREIKRQLRDVYGFTPSTRSTEHELVFDDVPDGDYPMTIEGKLDKVQVVNGKFRCCQFD